MSDVSITDLIAEARGTVARIHPGHHDPDALFQYRGGVLGREATLIIRELADALESVTVPTEPTRVAFAVHSRRSGKTQQMLDQLLDLANERGVRVQIVEQVEPEWEIECKMGDLGWGMCGLETCANPKRRRHHPGDWEYLPAKEPTA